MGDPVTVGTGMVSAGGLPGVVGGFGSLGGNSIATSLGTGLGAGFSLGGLDFGSKIAELKNVPIFGQEGVLSQFGQAGAAYNQMGNIFGRNRQAMPSMISASTQRGGQIAPVDYMSLLNPQQQGVIRPAPISLLQVMYGYI